MNATRQAPAPRPRDSDGPMMGELTRAVVGLHRDQVGRGPTRARCSWVDEDTVLCVMRDCFTRAERTLLEHGDGEGVRREREALASALRPQLRATAEATLERRVAAVLSQVSTDPEIAIELFVLEPPHGPPPSG